MTVLTLAGVLGTVGGALLQGTLFYLFFRREGADERWLLFQAVLVGGSHFVGCWSGIRREAERLASWISEEDPTDR